MNNGRITTVNAGEAEEPFEEVAKYQGWLDSTLRRIEYKQKAIFDVDARKEIPNDQPDRPDRFADWAKYRRELADEVQSRYGEPAKAAAGIGSSERNIEER